MALKILIAGAPAAGKGTQCEKIVEKHGVIHLSTGDILRGAVKNGTELGKKAKGFMNEVCRIFDVNILQGKLVPDELVMGIVKERLTQEDCKKKGWLLDGFPRTGKQAQFLKKENLEPNAVVLLDVPDEVLIERIEGRRTDPETGKIYHTKFNPAPDEVKKRLVQRSDDTKEKIVVRLKAYHDNIQAICDHFEKLVKKVDGNRKKEEVTKDVLKHLGGVKK